MTRQVVFHEAAEAELNEAADFYDYESPGLGTLFLEEVERTIGFITNNPEASPLIRGRVRSKVLRKFPFTIIYSLPSSDIRILALAHHKRRPFYWYGRRENGF